MHAWVTVLVRPEVSSVSWQNALCLQINLALVGLLNVSLALEDPFDNQGLDGIYIDEALFEAEQVHQRYWSILWDLAFESETGCRVRDACVGTGVRALMDCWHA